MTADRFLPLDIVSMLHPNPGTAAEERGWVTAYPAYRFISYDMVTAVSGAARSFHDRDDARIIVGAKLHEILCDLLRVARIGLDLRGIQEAGAKPQFDPGSSRLHAFLTDPELPVSHFFDLFWAAPDARGFRATARNLYLYGRQLMGLVAGRQPPDVLFVNGLLSEYFESGGPTRVPLPLPRHTLAAPGRLSRSTEETANALYDAFQGALPPQLTDGRSVAQRVALAAQSCIARHLSQAEQDLRQLRRSRAWRPMGSALMSGTPKYHGRLLAALYAEAGRRVIRFAHGGERGLFADLHWPIPELTFCDEYFFHGRGEANLVAARAINGSMARVDRTDPLFESLGSRKHQAILQRAQIRPARARGGKVMYVAGSYLAEIGAHYPAMCPPDPVYYEWQRWLLARLKNIGYEVVVKVHPKGINNGGGLLADLCSEIVLGQFDPNAYDVDCYLFDFAGTAFMDALAAGVGVVLLDHGVRPLDPAGAKLLDARVERVLCYFDELNRFRVETDLLAEAIDAAVDAPCLDRAAQFVGEYFSA